MNIGELDEFIELARNSKLITADYESRLGRLQAMLIIQKSDSSALLSYWIAKAEERLRVTKELYDAAKQARVLPIETLIAIHTQLKALDDE